MVALWVNKYANNFSDPCCYPLGFMYISAVLKQAGHDVKVFNNNLYDFSPELLERFETVLFTGFDEFMPENIRISKHLRSLGIKTIIGGAYATYRTTQAAQHFDCVVVGEGESAILRALDGVGIFKGGPVDLETLPLPDYEGFGITEYHRRRDIAYMGVLTSRGCPHSCTFCSSVCKYRLRPIKDVSDEIQQYIRKYDIKYVVFNDNTLNGSKKRFSDVISMMGKLGVNWSAALRLDNIDEELLRSAKESGLVYAVVGVESFRQKDLDRYRKNINVDSIVKGLDIFEKLGINYLGNILMETKSDFIRNIKYMKKYKVYPSPLQNFIGTDAKAKLQDGLTEMCRTYIEQKGHNLYV